MKRKSEYYNDRIENKHYLCDKTVYKKRNVNYQLYKPFKKIFLSYTNNFIRYTDDGIV